MHRQLWPFKQKMAKYIHDSNSSTIFANSAIPLNEFLW